MLGVSPPPGQMKEGEIAPERERSDQLAGRAQERGEVGNRSIHIFNNPIQTRVVSPCVSDYGNGGLNRGQIRIELAAFALRSRPGRLVRVGELQTWRRRGD